MVKSWEWIIHLGLLLNGQDAIPLMLATNWIFWQVNFFYTCFENFKLEIACQSTDQSSFQLVELQMLQCIKKHYLITVPSWYTSTWS